jgi:hypothetical protein
MTGEVLRGVLLARSPDCDEVAPVFRAARREGRIVAFGGIEQARDRRLQSWR